MTNLFFILLVSQHSCFIVQAWITSNEVYEDNEIISLDGNTEESEHDDLDEVDYNIEKPPIEREVLEKSRLLNLQENYIDPNIEHNLKIYEKYNTQKKKREAPNLNVDQYTLRYNTLPTTEVEYDYEKFKDEYDHDVAELKKNQAKVNDSDFTPPPKSECNFEAFLNIGPITMYCLIGDLCNGATIEIKRESKEKILRLLRIWGILLAIFFIFGWAHLGYCNWICPSKHCFPEDGNEEIKQKLVMDPPGTLTKQIIPKKDSNSKTVIIKEYYQPTESEYYLYNSLWQDIYGE